MSAHPPIIEAADAFLGRLAALDMQAAEHVHACLLDRSKPNEVAELARAYARASRCLRQTLALHAKLKGDRARGEREAERHAAQMARDAAAPPAPGPAFDDEAEPDRDQIYSDLKVEELRDAVDRVISKVADGDLTRHTRLVHRFERELDDWVDKPDFLETPLDQLVGDACEVLGLPDVLAEAWQSLPRSTFDPEPEELSVFDGDDEADDDDDDVEAGRDAVTRPDEPPPGPAEPPHPGADPARYRGSG